MRVLLDTHTLIFAIDNPGRLSKRATEILKDADVERWVSAVSLWEIAIKVRLGKLKMPTDRGYYLQHLAELRAKILNVDLRHSFGVFDLPLHHKDPFDRLLIAQAREEGLVVVSDDAKFTRYEVQTVW